MGKRTVHGTAPLTTNGGAIGMEWVGETEKYHHLRLQEYRLGPADLAASQP